MSDKKHEIIADIVAEMRGQAGDDGYPLDIKHYADRLEAEWKREREGYAKLREVLVKIRDGVIGEDKLMPAQIANLCDAALAAVYKRKMICNKDIGTMSDKSYRFYWFCVSHETKHDDKGNTVCIDCPCFSSISDRNCYDAWGELPYDEYEMERNKNKIAQRRGMVK